MGTRIAQDLRLLGERGFLGLNDVQTTSAAQGLYNPTPSCTLVCTNTCGLIQYTWPPGGIQEEPCLTLTELQSIPEIREWITVLLIIILTTNNN